MKRVLLTGATGFIGSAVLPLLTAFAGEVHAVTSRALDDQMDSGACWHQANLLDREQTKLLIARIKPTHCLHLAWYTEHGAFYESSENFRWVQASLDLMTAFAWHGGERLVTAGSCAEYDTTYGYCREYGTPTRPTSLYGLCKHTTQLLQMAHSRRMGYSAAWARLFYLYGAREKTGRLVPSVIRSILQHEPVRCSAGEQIRDFASVEDVARALIALLRSDHTGPVNIASGIPVKVKTIIEEIANQLDGLEYLRMGALPTAPDEPPLMVADVTRMRTEIGCTAQTPLRTGLEQTIQWWQAQGERVNL